MKPNTDWERISPAAVLIQQAKDFNEVVSIWEPRRASLRNAKLVYSAPESSNFPNPFRALARRFPKGGYLRCQYKYDYLFFLDERICMLGSLGSGALIRADMSVLLDTNVASSIGVFFNKESKAPKKEAVDEAIDFLIKSGLNFDYNFYALENASDYYAGRNVERIRQRIRDILKLDYLDRQTYSKRGVLRPTLNDAELCVAADEKLQQMYETDSRKKFTAHFQEINDLLYCLLLKIVSLQFRQSDLSPDQKVQELLRFMHFDLSTIFLRELVVALRYFRNPGELGFFGKVNRPRPEILELLRNMAWDLTLFHAMGKFGTVTLGGHFLIEYFLSFDRRMVELFDLYAVRAMISYGEDGQATPLAAEDPVELLKSMMCDSYAKAVVQSYFEPVAWALRNESRERSMIPDIAEAKGALEHEVKNLLS